MAFDVDGVLTDGSLYLSDSGEEIKAFNTLDGQGLKLLRTHGLELAIITARESKVVALRARNLGIEHVYQGVDDKLQSFEALRNLLGFSHSECGYMGDDLPDLCILSRCGFAASVPHASAAVKNHAHYVSTTAAGHGAVREVCEFILQARGQLDAAIASFLE
jgi:3-deoxy-D-manno-octulosonate 8-phosphate phosphatase (KDO 8-P phosphatase)